jgi:cob(I)alamin adenosyltransferase
VSEWAIRYVNRLSDLFFVLSRWAAKQAGKPEALWQRGLQEVKRKK